MSKWSIKPTAQYDRDIKRMMKRYPRETAQMLLNLEDYEQSLNDRNNPLLLVRIPFVHRESSGCHAITQQPLASSSHAQTRLYVYCYIQNRMIFLICAGDKQSQTKDNKYCTEFVKQF